MNRLKCKELKWVAMKSRVKEVGGGDIGQAVSGGDVGQALSSKALCW